MLRCLSLYCCRIAYQRNDDDEEEAARDRRRRARQERLRQKQEEESLGQVTDQVEAHVQNRYCPPLTEASLGCIFICPVEWSLLADHCILRPTQPLMVAFGFADMVSDCISQAGTYYGAQATCSFGLFLLFSVY